MRFAVVWLLALLLAACGDNDPSPNQPAERQDSSAELSPSPVKPATSTADRLRSEWMQIEHAGWAEAATAVPLPVEPAPVDDRPQLAIVIDDVGHSYALGRRIIDLLHLPMENTAGLSIGPGGLYSAMPREELLASLDDSLSRFAPIDGVNNHMGSRLTAERAPMDWVMGELQQRGLFFVDSRTTAQTQAAFAAEAAGVRNLSRDVFLDNQRDPEAIHRAFQRGLALARKNGSALLIGHPYPETLDVVVVSVQSMLARKYAPPVSQTNEPQEAIN